MKKYILSILSMALVLVVTTLCLSACVQEDKDMTAPTITDEGITANPINCQVYHPGEVIPFVYIFTDDTELGSFNIEVHGNFDHHSHSTESDEHEHEGIECGDEHEHEHGEGEEEEEEGEAWVYNQSFDIPAGQTKYKASLEIPIPADVRHGDYHFMIRVTDKAGWQQLKAIAIEIEE